MERVSQKVKRLPFTPATIAINGILLVVAGYWFYRVANVVPEPYLVRNYKVTFPDVMTQLQIGRSLSYTTGSRILGQPMVCLGS